MKTKLLLGLVIGVLATIDAKAEADQLLLNPSFETPVITSNNCGGGPPASCEGFNIGGNIGGWIVVGHPAPPGLFPIVLETNAFRSGAGIPFTSEDGNQNIDLSGSGNQGAEGLEQTVTTVPGTPYVLSFYIGNEDNTVPNFPENSSADLFLNGVNEGNFVSSGNVFHDLSWAHFTVDFVATTTSTTVEFINTTPADDNETGLDNVTLTSNSPAPLTEPHSTALFVVAAGVLLRLRQRPFA